MGRSGLLSVLHPPLDADYVDHFQRLADLNLELRTKGPTARRLLQKALLESALGNHHASREAAHGSVERRASAEALYHLGVSCLLSAYAEVGVLECHGGRRRVAIRDLLEEGHAALDRSCTANPSDLEAAQLRDQVRRVLDRHPEDQDLVAFLQHDVQEGRARRPRPQRG